MKRSYALHNFQNFKLQLEFGSVKSKVGGFQKFSLAFSKFMNFIYLTFPGVAPLLNMIKPVGSLVLNLNDRAPPRLLFQAGNTFEKQIQY